MPKLKILSRPSPLALQQVAEIMAQLPELKYEIIALKSFGDKNRQISLLKNNPADFFTRELDRALLSGEGDIAIHSAKDLPYPLPQGLEVIALTESLKRTDALVSANNKTLKQLPKNARVGTSSPIRREQLRKIRPDLKIVSVRGTIAERLALIEHKKIDALIVATCALQRLELEAQIAEILPWETHPLQGALAVVSACSRPEQKNLFAPLDVRKKYGKVFLVGSGPGDPELLTIRAAKLIEQAEIIFYDDLLDTRILAKTNAQTIYVGKRKGRHSLPQAEINEKLYRAALSGRQVVRLKCGDPFIFGRGGEELNYLQSRLIAVEVVPGVSSLQAAAASAAIPLTLRGSSNQLIVRTGHDAKQSKNGKTIVYVMGASRFREISQELRREGESPNTPVALIQNASQPQEKIIITTVARMPEIELASPVIILVGAPVNFFQTQAKLLFTGLNPESFKLSAKIFHYPLIELTPLKFKTSDLHKYDAFLFTSKMGVRAFLAMGTLPKNKKIIAIGPYTKRALEKEGMRVTYLPELADSDNLLPYFQKNIGQKILYPCSQLSDNKLHHQKNIRTRVVYRTTFVRQPKLKLSNFSGIVFTSSSTVNSFFRLYNKVPPQLAVYVYGKHTLQTLRERGYQQDVQTIQIKKS